MARLFKQHWQRLERTRLLADAAARKAMHKWADLAESEFITHCAAFLGRKGFAAGISFSTARNLWKELQREMEQ